MVTSRDITEAAEGLRGIARRTPLLYVEELGAHLKLENEQPIGAFKIRGAYNAIRKLPDAARRRGVITFSSGNHGQAVAFAAKQFGVRAVIVMPETTPAVKVEGVKKWGGEVVFAGRTSEDRRIKAEEIARKEQLAVVPPFDHPDIVAGQATVALEIVEQLPDVETVVVPVGGGGLISGVVSGLAAAGSKAGVWGVEPAGAPKLQRSLAAGKVVRLERTWSKMTASAPPCSFYGASASSRSSRRVRPPRPRCLPVRYPAPEPRCSWSAAAMWIARFSRQWTKWPVPQRACWSPTTMLRSSRP